MKNNVESNKDISLRINLGTRPIFGHGKAKLLDAISIMVLYQQEKDV